MPGRTPHIPKYRLHKASGQAVVTLNGRDHYLGPHGSPESHGKYHDLTARWQLRSRLPEAAAVDERCLSLNELFLAYWEHVQVHYRKDGTPTSEVNDIRLSMRELLGLYGKHPIDEFGPLALKTVRQAMIEGELSRGVINQRIGRIKRMVKWAVANELAKADTLQALQAVQGLQRGRSLARETPAVRPVPDKLLEAVLPQLASPVAAMVRLQVLTGMRPGEVCSMRPMDIDREHEAWVYTPESHKTEHHGIERRIFLGPKAQLTIAPFLLRTGSNYCFSPAESVQEKRREKTLNRRTSENTGNRVGTNRKLSPKKMPGEKYDTRSYRRAVTYACERVYPTPVGLEPRELQEWKQTHRFHPHQLRHNAATYLAREFGIEAAQTVLGHSTLAVTQVYAERDFQKAAEIMLNVG